MVRIKGVLEFLLVVVKTLPNNDSLHANRLIHVVKAAHVDDNVALLKKLLIASSDSHCK